MKRRIIFVIILILGMSVLLYGIKLAGPEAVHRFAANI
jgi:hypothetical protein